MKFHDIAEDLLSSREKIRLLKVLCTYPGKEFSSKELSDYSNVSIPGLHSILTLFERYGMVSYKSVAGSILWRVNPRHVLFNSFFKSYFVDETRILDNLKGEIRAKLEKFKEIKKVVLFGSVAHGSEEPISDIDICIEAEGWIDTTKVCEVLLIALLEKYGNQPSLFFVWRKNPDMTRKPSSLEDGVPLVLIDTLEKSLKAEIDHGQVLLER